MPEWFDTLDDDLWLRPDEVGQEEANVIFKALRLRKGQKVLDVPCGAGRIAVHLAAKGLEVTCLDIRERFIERARKRFVAAGVKGRFVCLDMRKIDFTESFDAIYNWHGSFGYFSEEENLQLIHQLAHALKAGGRLAIDQPHREYLLRHFKASDETNGAISHTKYDGKHGRFITDRTVPGRQKRNRSVVRVYTLSETRRMFEEAGLTIESVLGGHSGEPFTRGSRRMIVIGRKNC